MRASHGQHGGGRGSPKILSLRDSASAAKKCENKGGGEESPWFTPLTSLAGLGEAGEAQGPQKKSQQPPGDSGIGRRQRFPSQNPTSATK